MNAFALILVGLTVVGVAGWPGGLVGLIVGIRRNRTWAGAVAGFAGGFGGTVLGALIWTLVLLVLPKKAVRGEFGSLEGPAHVSEDFMIFLLWSLVLLGSCGMGWIAVKSKMAVPNKDVARPTLTSDAR